MPSFGIPNPLYAGEIFTNDYASWQQSQNRLNAPETKSRVIWVGLSACKERYQVAPLDVENPED